MQYNTFNDSSKLSPIEILKMRIFQCHIENVTHSMVVEGYVNLTSEVTCSKVFDGLLCWDDTPAGSVAYQKCPKDIYGWSPDQFAYKVCEEDGRWFAHPKTNKSWTNYTSCVDVKDAFIRECIINLNIAGYSMSFIALTISIITFLVYKLLYCTRTKVHINMLFSLALNCLSWIFWYTSVVKNVNIVTENPFMCRILTMINLYLMVCSYMWMFCEGLNLHISLVVVFVNQGFLMKIFVSIGWILPMIITIAYLCCRLIIGDVERCMIDTSHAFYIVSVPIAISMILSLYFLVRIVLVVLNKARNVPGTGGVVPASGPVTRFDLMKTIKPVLILIPTMGLYYILMPVHPPLGTVIEIIYAVVVSLLTSLQGLMVSILFCFKNEEVRENIKQNFERRQRLQQELNQISAATGGDSVHYAEHRV